MNNQSLFRYSGIAAIASVLLYVASMLVWMSADPQGNPPAIAGLLYSASSVAFLLPLYALFVIYRHEGMGLALLACLVLGFSMVASLFVDPSDLADPAILVLTVAYGVGSLLLGMAALRSTWTPRGTAILVLLMGVASLAIAPFIVAGATETVMLANLAVSVFYIIWLLWLARHFLTGHLAQFQAA